MRRTLGHISLIAVGINVGIFIFATMLGEQPLMITALLSGLACGLGFHLNKEKK
jgi:hypothetical protein